eukprot:gnl/MRDRNA2_/MRDRNA2_89621_c0_seq1.p1 gnl/MRDRNA2_/MRDRNA2_89621_c0~~gnl/MRDRNA2_/MRDRNA2_89621_c0_seq1.p1  ORF type:complete len:308 (-),score=35.29 gnl/MRDRNA2_/MRDRNA2_89621_c0_seq1:17-940(-)
MAQTQAPGGLMGTLFGQASRASLLKGALTVGLSPPSPLPDHHHQSDETQSQTPSHGQQPVRPSSNAPPKLSPQEKGSGVTLSRSPSVNPLEMQTCTPADVFSYYDHDSDGLLNKPEFARAIRACGGCPSEKQVNQWFKELASDEEVSQLPLVVQDTQLRGAPSQAHKIRLVPPVQSLKTGINKKTFAEEIPRLIHDSPGPSRSDILESLKTFTVQKDNQPGFILETETIRTVLGGMGPEHLQPHEVDAVLQGLEHKTGQIHFGSMLDRLSQRSSNPLLGTQLPVRKHPAHAGANKDARAVRSQRSGY